MKKLSLILIGVLFLGLSSGVMAVEDSGLEDSVVVQEEISDVEIPDVTSRWFGVSWAFDRVKHNFEVWIAKTDEKKTELEFKFAEKEEKLAERIAELEVTNPRLAEKLSGLATKLGEKRVERVKRIEERVKKMGEKGQRFEQRKEDIKKRIKRPLLRVAPVNQRTPSSRSPVGEKEEVGELLELRGDSVRIKNAKPGVVRMR